MAGGTSRAAGVPPRCTPRVARCGRRRGGGGGREGAVGRAAASRSGAEAAQQRGEGWGRPPAGRAGRAAGPAPQERRGGRRPTHAGGRSLIRGAHVNGASLAIGVYIDRKVPMLDGCRKQSPLLRGGSRRAASAPVDLPGEREGCCRKRRGEGGGRCVGGGGGQGGASRGEGEKWAATAASAPVDLSGRQMQHES